MTGDTTAQRIDSLKARSLLGAVSHNGGSNERCFVALTNRPLGLLGPVDLYVDEVVPSVPANRELLEFFAGGDLLQDPSWTLWTAPIVSTSGLETRSEIGRAGHLMHAGGLTPGTDPGSMDAQPFWEFNIQEHDSTRIPLPYPIVIPPGRSLIIGGVGVVNQIVRCAFKWREFPAAEAEPVLTTFGGMAAAGTTSVSADNLYLQRYVVPAPGGPFVRFGVHKQEIAWRTFKACLYADNGANYPGALLAWAEHRTNGGADDAGNLNHLVFLAPPHAPLVAGQSVWMGLIPKSGFSPENNITDQTGDRRSGNIGWPGDGNPPPDPAPAGLTTYSIQRGFQGALWTA